MYYQLCIYTKYIYLNIMTNVGSKLCFERLMPNKTSITNLGYQYHARINSLMIKFLVSVLVQSS